MKINFYDVLLFIKMPDTDAGAQWLSGRVLDSRPRGHMFEPQRRQCVVSLGKAHFNKNFILA